MTRAERHAQVKALKETGLTFNEIAAHLGLAKSTVTSAYYDPTGATARARKAHYSRPCIDCGAPLSGCNGHGPNAPLRCVACAHIEATVWTRETVIAAVRQWADEHGGIPPVATDWNTSLAVSVGRPPRSLDYPAVPTVQRVFGSWHAAIIAAGFDAFTVGHYGRAGEYPEIVAETVRLYRSGLSCAAVGARLGMSGNGVRMRLLGAGEPLRSPHDWRQQVAA